MKLYNLYQEVIFEESQKQLGLITEAVSDNAIIEAIEKKRDVWIYYNDGNGNPPSKRYLQIYVLGKSWAGNQIIRAYQLWGQSEESGVVRKWKTFLVSEIQSIQLTGKRWLNPVSDYEANIPSYKETGDKNFKSIQAIVDVSSFNRATTLNTMLKNNKKRAQEPTVYNQPEPEPKVGPTKPKTVEPVKPEPVQPKQTEPRPNLNKQNKPNLDSDKEEELEKDIYGDTNPAIR